MATLNNNNSMSDEAMHVDVAAGVKSVDESEKLSALLGKNFKDKTNLPTKDTWKLQSEGQDMKMDYNDEVFDLILQEKSSSKLMGRWERLWKTGSLAQHQVIVSSTFMVKLMEKLIDSNRSLDLSVITTILACDMISVRVCPGLIDIAIEQENYDLLHNCFVHLRDISEKDIVRCLNSLLPIQHEDLPPDLDNLICALLNLPFTEDTLVEEFRHLQFEKTMILMSYLSTKLKNEDLLSNFDINQVHTWLALLVDAHFSQIIIHPEAWQIIVDLQETMAVQMELYKELTELDVTLNKIQHSLAAKKLKVDQHQKFLYKIEVMSI